MKRSWKADCLFFTGEKPCRPNKEQGYECSACPKYQAARKRYLVIKLGAIGDVLRTTALLAAWEKEPGAPEIWWITERESFPLLKPHPRISVLLSPEEWNAGYWETVFFDKVFGLDMDRRAAAIFMTAQAREKKGFGLSKEGKVVPWNRGAFPWFQMGIFDRLKKENRKTYQEHLFSICGMKFRGERPALYLTDDSRRDAKQFAKKHRLQRYSTLIGAFVGAGGRWEGKKLSEKQWRHWLGWILKNIPKTGIVLLGGPAEQLLMKKLEKKLRPHLFNGGLAPLDVFAAKVELCDLILTADTLALHVAVALKKRFVAFFGPTAAQEIETYGLGETITAPDCRCFYQPVCTQASSCLEKLPLDLLTQAVKRQWTLLQKIKRG